MYIEYLKYVLEHKKNIIKACDFWYKEWLELYPYSYDKKSRKKLKKILRNIKLTHDLSKFSLEEFKPYANWFYGEYGVNLKEKYIFNEVPINKAEESLQELHNNCKSRFDKSWFHHFKNNKHHWNYWCYDWYKWINTYNRNISTLVFCELEKPMKMDNKYIIEMIIDWTAMSYKFCDTPQKFYLSNYHKIKLNRETRFQLEIKLGLLFYNYPICECNEEYWMTIEELKNSGCNLNDLLKKSCERYNINFDDYDI